MMVLVMVIVLVLVVVIRDVNRTAFGGPGVHVVILKSVPDFIFFFFLI
jgi:hypothetical protein